ncbi:phosphate starvation-inducible protein PhoH, partial [Candidatus Desantisbacteria bacterium CG07_land_8_20_14_0_80_39_15]
MARFFDSVKLIPRGNELIIDGEKTKVENAFEMVSHLLEIVRSGGSLGEGDIQRTLRTMGRQEYENDELSKFEIPTQKKVIKPKTNRQKDYIKAIQENDIVFSIGPAGTGKTYLAMAMVIHSLLNRDVGRIILVRPVVEVGEKLGFLPGDIYAKVDPYFRPLYDALYEMMDVEKMNSFIEKGIIEIAPLAYMRGRTLNDSFIILDEAQNTTPEQMKMFLTRLGFGSRVVITGDITQIDLKEHEESGLVQIQDVLSGIKGISFIYFTHEDIVRHELVQKIIQAYEKYGLNN